MSLSCTKKIVKRFLENRMLAERMAAGQGLRIRYFDEWHPVLDDALREFPETELCPHELFRELMQNRSSTQKITILFTEDNIPVALAGLRRWGDYWIPVTNWIIPGILFPFKKGCLERVIRILGLEMHVGWWRQEIPPPNMKEIRNISVGPTYGLKCSNSFEDYWKSSGHLKRIRNVRRKTNHFRFEINPPGGSEWIIKNWEKTWRPKELKRMRDLEDRLIAAKYLERIGLHSSLLLSDRGQWVSGNTFIIHKNDPVWQLTYRDRNYDSYGVGTRILDLSFQWASNERFNKIDLGGDHDYKKLWAPEDGLKYMFRVCPSYLAFAQEVFQLSCRVKNKLCKGFN